MKSQNLSFIKCALNDNSLISLSWGINNLMFSESEVNFEVNALKFKGKISITIFKDDILCINFKNEAVNYRIFSTREDIIENIDNIIEFGEGYREAISK